MKPTTIYICCDPRTHEPRYVGKTVSPLEKRIYKHLHNDDRNHASNWFRRVGNPYYFDVEVVPAGGDWIEAEQHWILYLRGLGANLTNSTLGGEGLQGFAHSDETRAKLSKLNKGRVHTERSRRNMSIAHIGINKGIQLSEDRRKAISKAKTGTVGPMAGKTHSAETKARMSAAQLGNTHGKGNAGRVFSEETKAKISASKRGVPSGRKGIPMSEEQKAKLSAAHKGKTISAETRAKMSESAKRYVFTDEHKAKISAAKLGKPRKTKEVL